MKSKQYTIRSIPSHLDATLRKRSQASGKSLNATALEAMSKGLGVGQNDTIFHDLDWFIGSASKSNQAALQQTQDWLATLPSDMDEIAG